MTIFYPDVSAFQQGWSPAGWPAVCVKATEGNYYTDPLYAQWKDEAARHGVFFIGYNFLIGGAQINVAAQAAYCYRVVGSVTPLMVDPRPRDTTNAARAKAMAGQPLTAADHASLTYGDEVEGNSRPTIEDAFGFLQEYRRLGGKAYLLYLPRWYWSSPPCNSGSLEQFVKAGCYLVSSDYTSYSDHGSGYDGYGGFSEATCWQYTDAFKSGGQSIDVNAFRGIGGKWAGKQDAASVAGCLADFKSIALTGRPHAEPVPHPAPAPAPVHPVVHPVPAPVPVHPVAPAHPVTGVRVEGGQLDLLTKGGPALAALVPQGATVLVLAADPENEAPPKLRIATRPNYHEEEITVAWDTSPVTVALPAGTTVVSMSRVDTDSPPVPVSYGWA